MNVLLVGAGLIGTVQEALEARGFAVQRVCDMSGWLAYHAVFVAYWAHSMRSPMGELAFAVHSRHAEGEMRVRAQDVLAELVTDGEPASLWRLLSAAD